MVVAAFADFQVGIVPWRELDACCWNQVHKGVVRLGAVGVYGIHHRLRGVRASYGQHFGVYVAHQRACFTAAHCWLCAQAARNDDFAVFGQRVTNGFKAFLHGLVNKAAGVHNHQVCIGKGFAGGVAFGAELGKDKLRIGQRLGAAQADKADFGGGCVGG